MAELELGRVDRENLVVYTILAFGVMAEFQCVEA
jgi:hypothetical protein